MSFNKHLLILMPGFAADEQDDTCIPLLQSLMKSYREMHPDVKISLIAFEYPFTGKLYSWHSIDVYPCNGRNRKFPFKILNWLKVIRLAKRIHQNNPIDFVHAFWMDQCALVGSQISRKFKIPLLVTLMGQDAKKENKYLKLLKLESIPTVALSRFQAAVYRKSTGLEVKLINPIGLSSSELKSSQKNNRSIDVIGVGSLIELKNYSAFIDIIHNLKVDFPKIKAWIIGFGPEEKKLRQKIKDLNLVNNIELKGLLSRKESLEAMSNSKIFLHSSTYESQGYVFSEAKANGCYVISKPVGIATESDYWKIGSNVKELTSNVKSILKNYRTPPDNVEVEKIENTTAAYFKIYDEEA